MTDNGEGGESNSRGNEWEVVSLTESAYVAAPGPREAELNDDGKTNIVPEEGETSRALFMSSHFAFPPSQHENLPLESENAATEFAAEEEGRSSGKDDENLNLKGLNVSDDFPDIQFSGEKGGTNLQDLIEDQNVYSAAKYTSFPDRASLGSSTPYEEETALREFIGPSEQDFDDGEITVSPRASKDNEHGLPCGAWWKRRAVSLYSHAREANAFWSVIVAAAVMGLVILGHQWQQERWQTLHLKWQIKLGNEVGFWYFSPFCRCKGIGGVTFAFSSCVCW